MRELRPPARMKMMSGVLLRFGTPLLKGRERDQSNKKIDKDSDEACDEVLDEKGSRGRHSLPC
jgi:hypothetical protein